MATTTNNNTNYNKWKSSKIYGSLEVKDLLGITGAGSTGATGTYIIDNGVLTIGTNRIGVTGTNNIVGYTNTTDLNSTYVKISDAASTYLTSVNASATYQTKSDMTNYKTVSSFNTDIANYKTTASFNTDIANYKTTASFNTDIANYLTTANATTTYQPKSLMTNYLTTATASTTYQPIGSYLTSASLTPYQLTSGMSSYLTTSTASTTYQPIGSYLTTSTASTTYQPIGSYLTSASLTPYQLVSGMSNYLLSSVASTTYQPIGSYLTSASLTPYQLVSGMTNYLLSSVASTTYQPIGSYLTSNDLTPYANVASSITSLQTKTTNQSFSNNVTSLSGETQVNDIASTVNLAVGNDLLVSGVSNLANLSVLNSISCNNLNVRSSAQYDFKIVGYLRASDFIPICKTIQSTSNFCNGAFNLNTILLGSGVTLFLLPTYKVVMYNANGQILYTADNTSGNDMGYYNVSGQINVTQIFIYNNNILIL